MADVMEFANQLGAALAEDARYVAMRAATEALKPMGRLAVKAKEGFDDAAAKAEANKDILKARVSALNEDVIGRVRAQPAGHGDDIDQMRLLDDLILPGLVYGTQDQQRLGAILLDED